MQVDHLRDKGIFGTPPEPVFNLKTEGMKPELLEQLLLCLAEKNTTAVKEGSGKQGYFKTGECAEFMFLTCEKLRLCSQAKYLSMELFDNFMVRHVRDLYEHVLNLSGTNQRHDWQTIMERVYTQVPLRIVSCCQVASKLTSHSRVVSPRRAQLVLNEFGHRYSSNSILQSELRVLKTLNYKVMLTTPLVYVETILEILGHNDPSTEVKVFYGVCLTLLDFVYLKRSHIYNQLFALHDSLGKNKSGESSGFERDSMLLAVVVITVASYLLDQTQTDKVTEGLSHITQINSDRILDFATAVVQAILTEQ